MQGRSLMWSSCGRNWPQIGSTSSLQRLSRRSSMGTSTALARPASHILGRSLPSPMAPISLLSFQSKGISMHPWRNGLYGRVRLEHYETTEKHMKSRFIHFARELSFWIRDCIVIPVSQTRRFDDRVIPCLTKERNFSCFWKSNLIHQGIHLFLLFFDDYSKFYCRCLSSSFSQLFYVVYSFVFSSIFFSMVFSFSP